MFNIVERFRMLVVMFFDGVFVYMREFVKIFDVEEVEIIYCKFL